MASVDDNRRRTGSAGFVTRMNEIDAGGGTPHIPRVRGVVAQLVEHHNGIVGVISSILFGSTIFIFFA